MSEVESVILEELYAENFKGGSFRIQLNDGTNTLRGTNGSGKSRFANAFFWLTMGVDAQDRTNYELYDSTLEFTPENAIQAVVGGVFRRGNIRYEFKRCAKQKWVRPRGKSEYVKDKSDEYTFYVDGLAVSANVYKERIEALFAPIDKLKLMLNVRYYQTLDWKKLRKHFSDMVGIIDESELQGDYTSIKSLLDKFGSVDLAKEKLRQEINPKKKASESLDAEIKGMKSMLPPLDGVAEAERERDEKTARITEIDKEILGLGEANKPFVGKRNAELKAIAEKKESLSVAEQSWAYDQNTPIRALQEQSRNIEKMNREIQESNDHIGKQRKSLQSQLDIARQQHQFYSEERDRLAEEKDKAKALTFDENQVCQSCGQPLPYDKVVQIREKFYADRDAKVKAIIAKGVRARDNRDAQDALAKDLEKQIAELPEPKPLLDLAELEARLALVKSTAVPFERTDIYAQLTKEIADMESNLTVVPEVDSAELVAEKKRLNDEIAELNTIIGRKAERERGEERIIAKEDERYEVGVELARLEGLFDKCVEREREWASIVRDRANKHLHYSHVEMTELTKAGELVDVCTLTARKVGSGSQNNATQILIGVDLAQAFQANAGINLPIFIDNAEGIVDSNLPETNSQLCLLYVDERFPTMVIEGSEEYHKRLEYLAEQALDRERKIAEQDAERGRRREEVLDALGL